ncbi:Platinum sensitivity protein [Ascosphaera acerosa]|nr:Platinum sensitivity protein [Ascosphaera acerosa]
MQIPRPEERKRVKVYELRDSDWFDRGTGMCYADTSEENPMIVVESEERPGTMLLETKVMRKDVYQKQQETLIVWTDVSGTDLALSFQEAGGCASMWNFVSSFQTYFRNSNPDDSVSDDALDELTTPITLPSPSLGNLPEIERIISAASSPMQGRGMLSRDTLSRYILQKDYLARLVPLVAEAEDFEDLEDLHRLCNIMKMIILLNDNAIVEAAVSDELWEGVVGALEYDPDFPTQKANHRQYLSDGNRYKEVVPIQDPDIRNKIRCTWRLQYLKDVVLARIIDDPTYSVLNSLIFFNQVAIVQHLQHSPTFMRDVFELFRQDDVQRKEDAIRFLYQCTLVAKNLQPPGRSALYLDFVGHGVFDAITFALSHHKSSYRATGVDVLMSLLDHDQGAMREHLLLSRREQSRLATDRTQSASKSPIWITDILVNLLHTEQDLGVKMQASDAIKVLLEPIWFFGEPLARPLTAAEIERVEQAEETGFVGGSDTAPSATQEPTLESLIMRRRFDVAMVRLFSPLRGLSRDSLSRLSLQQSAMYEHLLDILSCFIRSHVFWGKRFMYSQGLMARVAMLLDAPQKHLQLAALQTVRTLLFLNDTFYFGEMSQHNIYGRLLGIITATMPRDNLLSSACLELFESVTRHMTNQNAIAKPVVLHLGAAHRQTLCSINHVDTFHKILRKFDWLQGYAEPLDLAQLTATDPDALSEGAWARVKGPRVIAGGQSAYQGLPEDPAQEEYFEGNDDDEEEEEEEEEDEAADVTSPPKQQQSSLWWGRQER